jgi:hypothetical protein
LKFSTVSIANVFDHIQTFLKWSFVPLAALAAMAFVSTTRPASAGEYCRKDVTSQVVSLQLRYARAMSGDLVGPRR